MILFNLSFWNTLGETNCCCVATGEAPVGLKAEPPLLEDDDVALSCDCEDWDTVSCRGWCWS